MSSESNVVVSTTEERTDDAVQTTAAARPPVEVETKENVAAANPSGAETKSAKKKKKKNKNAASDTQKVSELQENASTNATPTEGSEHRDAAVLVDAGQLKSEDVKNGDDDAAAAGENEGDVSKAAAKRKEKKKKAKEKTAAAEKTKTKKKKTPADLIKEMMRKREEEEEKFRKQQEEEQRRLEELERQREEKLRLEKEKKERKKQKEKERIERLKREGKYLTAEQRQKLQRQRANLEMLKQQGIIIPALDGDKADNNTAKKTKPYDKKKRKKDTAASSEEKSPEAEDEKGDKNTDETAAVEETEKPEEAPETEADAETNEVVESWDQIESEDEQQELDREIVSKGPGEDEEEKETEDEESSAEESSEISSESEENEQSAGDAQKVETKEELRERIMDRIEKRKANAEAKRSVSDLRAPVICVLGHVDTGKTKILDKIRRTHVQDMEAGGITQQIGATFVPAEAIKEQGKMIKELHPESMRIPGFLIIDTPGHESFGNLRSRGSSLCDLAVLVVDIMHGLEPQTIESLNLLKKGKTPFIVALNKIDRLYEWKSNPRKDVRAVLRSQQKNTQEEFDERLREVVRQFAEEGLNVTLFWDNADPDEYISMVPVSALSGDGMGNLMASLAIYSCGNLQNRLAFSEWLQCTVLEVKVLPGLGTTVDLILQTGILHVGDTLVLAGSEGPIVTQIRELLMPQPLREMRVKNPYEHYKEVRGAQGVKVLAKDLDKALAGLPVSVAQQEDEVDVLKELCAENLKRTLLAIRLSERGVYVQASTLGSLEALLEFLRSQKIPYCGISIGPIHKKDVMKASTMLEHDKQWAVILGFDVKIERDAQLLAEELGVKIFLAEIIYHLQDAFLKYREELLQAKKQEFQHLAVFPCKLRVLPQHVYNSRDPMVMGVVIEDGVLKLGTPICVPSRECIDLGTVTSIEINHKPIDVAKKGLEVCIKIENTTGDAPKMYGRHFDYNDMLISKISRETIDVCKQYFRDDLQKSDWQLIVELKKIFSII